MQAIMEDVVRLAPGRVHELPSARRAEPAHLAREVELVGRSAVVMALLRAVDATLLVLNAQRQVVAVSAPGGDGRALLGLRPGEALGCHNARGGGCGTTAACRVCGALGAVLACQGGGQAAEAECQLGGPGAGEVRDLSVRATRVLVEGAPFTVVTLRDVSVERRCERLEQLFVHDLLNTVTGLRGWAWRLGRPGADVMEAGAQVERLSRRLEREIRDHRALILAERGELQPRWEAIRALALLREVDARHLGAAGPPGGVVELAQDAADLELETDPALLTRVLVNMVKNALEAEGPRGTVRVGCDAATLDGPAGPRPAARLWVQNPGVMPEEVQRRVFQRGFSSKAARGRGLGTYGMKLLGERYLGGQVAFSSAPGRGTVFEILLPR